MAEILGNGISRMSLQILVPARSVMVSITNNNTINAETQFAVTHQCLSSQHRMSLASLTMGRLLQTQATHISHYTAISRMLLSLNSHTLASASQPLAISQPQAGPFSLSHYATLLAISFILEINILRHERLLGHCRQLNTSHGSQPE